MNSRFLKYLALCSGFFITANTILLLAMPKIYKLKTEIQIGYFRNPRLTPIEDPNDLSEKLRAKYNVGRSFFSSQEASLSEVLAVNTSQYFGLVLITVGTNPQSIVAYAEGLSSDLEEEHHERLKKIQSNWQKTVHDFISKNDGLAHNSGKELLNVSGDNFVPTQLKIQQRADAVEVLAPKPFYSYLLSLSLGFVLASLLFCLRTQKKS